MCLKRHGPKKGVAMNENELRPMGNAWEAILPQLARLCRRIGGDDDRGNEIFQRASVRIIRNLDKYRGEASLMTWASVIAHRERDRLFAQQFAESRRRLSVGAEALPELVEARPAAGEVRLRRAELLASAARAAAISGELNKVEARVILARLDSPDATWQKIGTSLSMSAAACAQAHCRGIVALRVYVFTHRPDLLGGMQAVATAFASAKADIDNPMTPDERMAFSQVVLMRTRGYSRRGWREALRSACWKVSRKLEMDDE
jgi:DNA-directed RNA polymerase specialized sigma24 family protein